MPFDYFTWSSLELRELTVRLQEFLDEKLRSFKSEEGDLHETEQGFAARDYLRNVKGHLSRWADHFEVKLSPSAYDHTAYTAGSLWPRFDCQQAISDLMEPLKLRDTGKIRRYRPRVFERATCEVLTWLKRHPADVDRVHPRSFEAIVAEVIKEKGWEIELTKQTRDGGFDILAIRTESLGFEIKMVIECKLYNPKKSVGCPIVDRIMGVSRREHADVAMVVTKSRFTDVAWHRWQQAVTRELSLIDREDLFLWLQGK